MSGKKYSTSKHPIQRESGENQVYSREQNPDELFETNTSGVSLQNGKVGFKGHNGRWYCCHGYDCVKFARRGVIASASQHCDLKNRHHAECKKFYDEAPRPVPLEFYCFDGSEMDEWTTNEIILMIIKSYRAKDDLLAPEQMIVQNPVSYLIGATYLAVRCICPTYEDDGFVKSLHSGTCVQHAKRLIRTKLTYDGSYGFTSGSFSGPIDIDRLIAKSQQIIQNVAEMLGHYAEQFEHLPGIFEFVFDCLGVDAEKLIRLTMLHSAKMREARLSSGKNTDYFTSIVAFTTPSIHEKVYDQFCGCCGACDLCLKYDGDRKMILRELEQIERQTEEERDSDLFDQYLEEFRRARILKEMEDEWPHHLEMVRKAREKSEDDYFLDDSDSYEIREI